MRLIDATIQPMFLAEYILERKNTFIRILEKSDNDFLFGLLMDYFDEQPTAYDVDKVVEQLEKKIQTHECCIEYEKKNGTITEEFQQRKAVEVLKGAIEIVKGGGVNG